MNKLLELAERCEKATGPDREMDAAVAARTGWSAQGRDWLTPGGISVNTTNLPRFTASLDAAMTLVDAYDRIELGGWERGQAGTWATISLDTSEFEGQAATPALALCAAALRARAAQGGDQ